MREHPSWMTGPQGVWGRIFRTGDTVWHAAGKEQEPQLTALSGDGPKPTPDAFHPADLSSTSVPAPLLTALDSLGEVQRLRNTDLWDAIGTSVLRQVVRAGQAKIMYRRFCEAYGEGFDTSSGRRWLFPTPEVVETLSDRQFDELGLAFKRAPLRAAAAAFTQYGDKWADMDPPYLIAEIQAVHRIGPWTAGAAVADYTNDWSLYPYSDLAVRKWAAHAAPELTWPDNELAFARRWKSIAGEQLSTLTVLTLAWGGQHGDIG